MMDSGIQQRSASHGSLQNVNSHSRTPSGQHSLPLRPSSQRRPLRSVNENSTFLRSPGPLESMLKTTTETGDIGIFSIKPPMPPATYHQPPRPRPYLGDRYPLPRSRTRTYDEGYCQDDRRWLPSYRDTTSEIISLYGSDTQPSYSRSFSPPTDDSRRSYSLTTCSSRNMPPYKSRGTLQCQSSMNALQRPRSPFPYPTRLKRPGVRPSSPAYTESGGIDYSRMVEVDRVSQRTIHGSYKPSYNTGSRRPPPLSLRSDANRSTVSLPSRASPGPYHPGYGYPRARTPCHNFPRTPRPSHRYRGDFSADQSIRSASLTSIVEMYQRPMVNHTNQPSVRSTGSFYYDYSEGFEESPPEAPEDIPICPIPQRAGTHARPLVLREESHLSFNANAAGAHGAEANVDPTQTHEQDDADLEPLCEEQELGQYHSLIPLPPTHSAPIPSTGQQRLEPNERLDDLRQTNSTGQMDGPNREGVVKLTEAGNQDAVTAVTTTVGLPEASAGHQQEHGRETFTEADDRMGQDQAHENGETVSEQPVAPAREFKVKRSQPRLMKALPPLPAQASQTSNTVTETSCGREELHLPLGLENHKVIAGSANGQIFSGASNNFEREKKEDAPPKFKVRVKASPPPCRSQEAAVTPNSCWSEERAFLEMTSDISKKPKFRLRISRSQVGRGRDMKEGAFIDSKGLKQCKSLAEIAPASKRKAGSGQNDQRTKLITSDTSERRRVEHRPEPRDPAQVQIVDASDPFDIQHPSSPVVAEVVRLSKSSTRTLIGKESHASSPNVVAGFDQGGHHGLRKKISQLRLRMPRRQASTAQKISLRPPLSEIDPDVLPTHHLTSEREPDQPKRRGAGGRVASRRSVRVGKRVQRWAKDAKKAVRSCVRRTLEAPSRLNPST